MIKCSRFVSLFLYVCHQNIRILATQRRRKKHHMNGKNTQRPRVVEVHLRRKDLDTCLFRRYEIDMNIERGDDVLMCGPLEKLGALGETRKHFSVLKVVIISLDGSHRRCTTTSTNVRSVSTIVDGSLRAIDPRCVRVWLD